jgi:hypothetical protein
MSRLNREGVMKKYILIGSALAALVIIPLLATTTANAQSRKNVGSNYGYCKSGEKVSDMKQCKENGGSL